MQSCLYWFSLPQDLHPVSDLAPLLNPHQFTRISSITCTQHKHIFTMNWKHKQSWNLSRSNNNSRNLSRIANLPSDIESTISNSQEYWIPSILYLRTFSRFSRNSLTEIHLSQEFSQKLIHRDIPISRVSNLFQNNHKDQFRIHQTV